jgi:lysozyme family protein
LPAGVDLVVFDYSVNSGPARAWGAYSAVKGQTTESAIVSLCEARLRFLRSLRTWSTFGPGWQRRVTKVQKLALDMARASMPTKVPEAPKDAPVPLPAPKPAEAPKVNPKVAGGAAAAGTTAVTAGFSHSITVGLIVLGVVATLAVAAYLITHRK